MDPGYHLGDYNFQNQMLQIDQTLWSMSCDYLANHCVRLNGTQDSHNSLVVLIIFALDILFYALSETPFLSSSSLTISFLVAF